MADDFVTLWSPEAHAFQRADFVDPAELDEALSVASDRSFKPAFLPGTPVAAPEPEPVLVEEELEQDPEVDLETLVLAAREQGASEVRAQLQAQLDELQGQLAEVTAERDALAQLDAALHTFRAEAREQAVDDVVQLALAMARRIVGESLALHPDALPGVVRGVLEQLPSEDEITVKVRPEDAAAIETRLRGRRGVKVGVDSNIDAGCVVEATFGTIDATLDTAMAGLERAVREWREDG